MAGSTQNSDLADALPIEWRRRVIGDVAKVVRGSSPRPAGDPRFFDGDYLPWITVADVTRLKTRDLRSTASKLTEEGSKRTRILEPGTLLLTNSGATLGVPGVTMIQAGANDGIAAFLDLDGVDRNYLYCFLQTRTRHLRERVAPGVGQPNLNTDLISEIPLVLPPLHEQRAIASLMDEWDNQSSRLSAQMGNCRIRLRGLMQQLLTGRRRLPAFAGEAWDEDHLGDLFAERAETGRLDLPLLSITADRGVIPRHEIDRKDTSNADKSKYKRIAPGDIGYNTMRMWQGVSALSSLEGIVSPAYTICIPGPKIDGRFARWFFKFPPVVNLFYRYSQGLVDDTLNLKYPHFAEIKVRVPTSLDEQRAIADILDTAQREIELLDQLRVQIQLQKRGLMQKLLTGEIRVKGGSVAV